MSRKLSIWSPMLALALLATPARALDVTLQGTFTMNFVSGTPGADLLGILGHENGWTIVLHDVQFPCDETLCPFAGSTKITNIVASSFSFQFTGPDATMLNSAVGQHFTQGGLTPHGAFFQADRGDCDFGYRRFIFYIWPPVPAEGVYMQVDGEWPAGTFPDDPNGCPTIGGFDLPAIQVTLFDRRPGNAGNVAALNAGRISMSPPTAVRARTWAAVKAFYR